MDELLILLSHLVTALWCQFSGRRSLFLAGPARPRRYVVSRLYVLTTIVSSTTIRGCAGTGHLPLQSSNTSWRCTENYTVELLHVHVRFGATVLEVAPRVSSLPTHCVDEAELTDSTSPRTSGQQSANSCTWKQIPKCLFTTENPPSKSSCAETSMPVRLVISGSGLLPWLHLLTVTNGVGHAQGDEVAKVGGGGKTGD